MAMAKTKKHNTTPAKQLPDMRSWSDEQIAAYFEAEEAEEPAVEGVEFSLDGGEIIARDTETGEIRRAHSSRWAFDLDF